MVHKGQLELLVVLLEVHFTVIYSTLFIHAFILYKNVQMQRAMAVWMADIWLAANKVDLGVHSCVSLINSASGVHTLSLFS